MEPQYTREKLLMTPEQLETKIGEPNLCVIDVRPAEQFAQGHIPGAVHFDLFGLSLVDTTEAPLKAFMHMIHHVLELRMTCCTGSTNPMSRSWIPAVEASISGLRFELRAAALSPAPFTSSGRTTWRRTAHSNPMLSSKKCTTTPASHPTRKSYRTVRAAIVRLTAMWLYGCSDTRRSETILA